MRVLLDTHTLLWAFMDSPRLSRTARNAIIASTNRKLVSPVSAIEITLKYRRGKLAEAAPFVVGGQLVLDDLDVEPLPITMAHGSLAGSLDIPHKDPFDRLLIAQSIVERIPLVSNEAIFDRFGVERLW